MAEYFEGNFKTIKFAIGLKKCNNLFSPYHIINFSSTLIFG